MLLFLTAILSLIGCSFGSLSCLDQNGNPIDWYAALKQPNGYNFQWYNGENFTAGGSLESPSGSAIALTLGSLYSCSNCGYAMYNDESAVDGSNHESNAHMKGVIAFDGVSGFWLIHSVPKFPPAKANGYSYPLTGTKYGQSFLCLSLSTSTFDTIGQQLKIDNPFVYDSSVPSALSSQVPNLAAFLNQGTTSPVRSNIVNIATLAGREYDIFAKSSSWGYDLYEYLVANHYYSDMYTETWQNGIGNTGSYCRPNYSYDVANTKSLTFPDGTSWPDSSDHSKWGITVLNNTVCIGDINRQTGQFHRGGGTACTQDATLWTAFRSLITTSDACAQLGLYDAGSGSSGAPSLLVDVLLGLMILAAIF